MVRTQDGAVTLSEREGAVLEHLVHAAGEPVSRDALAHALAPGNARAIDYAVRRLRSKIEANPAQPRIIHSVHGVGYRLGSPMADAASPHLDDSQRLVLSDRWVDLSNGIVHHEGQRTPLTPLQRALLLRLIQADGTALSRPVLLRDVWGSVVPGQRRLVDTVIRQLRAAIEAHPAQPTHVLTERGVGYRLHVPNRLSNVRPALWTGVARAETDAITALVRAHRWVTLVGVAGCGKSWLARQVALRSREQLPGGAWWADVVDCTTVHDVVQRIADVLRIPSRTLSVDGSELRAAMTARPERLLVIDGLRAGIDADSLLHSLATHDRLRLLVTSTQAPKTTDSYRYVVPELPATAAHELFVARFRSAGGQHDPPEDAVRDVCAAVRFNPKAIELAAHRALNHGMSNLDSLVDRDAIQTMLTESLRGAPAHAGHALATLTVFQSPFRAEDAQYVANVSSSTISELIDRHLLTRPEPGWLRVYPLSRSALPGPNSVAQQRHAQCIRAFFEAQSKHFRTAGGVSAHRQCRQRIADGRAACQWYLEQPDPSPCVDLLLALLACASEPAPGIFALLERALTGPRFEGRHRLWLVYAESRRIRLDQAQDALQRAKEEGAAPDSFRFRLAQTRIDDRLHVCDDVNLGPEPSTHPDQVDWLNATARFTSRATLDDAMTYVARARAVATAQHDSVGLLSADFSRAQLWMKSLQAPAVAASQFARLRQRYIAAGRQNGAAATAFMAADMWLEVGQVDAALQALDWVDEMAVELPIVRAMAYPELIRLRAIADTLAPTQLVERSMAAATERIEYGDRWFAGNFEILARIGWARLGNVGQATAPPTWASDHTDIAMIFAALCAAVDRTVEIPVASPDHWAMAHALVTAAQSGEANGIPVVRAIAEVSRRYRLAP